MAAQYDRIISVATLLNVRIGIIPLGVPVSTIPWCSIDLYDDLPDGEPTVVDVELPHGEVWVTEPEDVRVYQDIIDRLWESALTGDEARAAIRRLPAVPSP